MRSVIAGRNEHALDTFTDALFTEHHLKNGMVNRFPRNLASNHVELAMRDLEVGGRIFVLRHPP